MGNQTLIRSAVSRYAKDLQAHPPLEPSEERRLIRAYAGGDIDAGNRLVASHLRYVAEAAKRYVGQGVSYEDLVQEGNLGLLQALQKLDARRPGRFLAYAKHWVRSMMVRAILEKGSLVKVDRNVGRRIEKMRKLDCSIALIAGRKATAHEVASHLGVTTATVRKLRNIESFRYVSLDQTVSAAADRSRRTLYAFVAAPQATTDEVLSGRATAEALSSAFEKAREMLGPREQKILEERLLREPDEGKTRAQLAKEMGLSRSRVQQIESGLMRSLHRLLRYGPHHENGEPPCGRKKNSRR